MAAGLPEPRGQLPGLSVRGQQREARRHATRHFLVRRHADPRQQHHYRDSNTISYYFRGDPYYEVRGNEVVVIVVAVGKRKRNVIYDMAVQR